MAKRKSRKKKHGDQLIVGYCGSSDRLFEQLDKHIGAGLTVHSWNDLARGLGLSRQGLVSSVKRSQVPFSRLREICQVLGINVLTLVDQPMTLKENAELL